MGDTEPLVSSGFPGRQSTGGLRGCGRHKSGIGPEAALCRPQSAPHHTAAQLTADRESREWLRVSHCCEKI